jgi:hypothetical protein
VEMERIMKQPPSSALLLLQIGTRSEVVGDLLEEYPAHGDAWFWCQTVRAVWGSLKADLQRAPGRCAVSAVGGYAVMYYIGMVSFGAFQEVTHGMPWWFLLLARDVGFGLLASLAGGYVAAGIRGKCGGFSGSTSLVSLAVCLWLASYAASLKFHPAIMRPALLLLLGVLGITVGGFYHGYQRR